MRGCVVEGNIELTLKNGNIVLLAERDNKTLDEITLEDDSYRDSDDLAKELLGQVMAILEELTDLDTLKETIGRELKDNY